MTTRKELVRGDDVVIESPIYDRFGAPLSLTGITAAVYTFMDASGGTVFTKSLGSGIAANGEYQLDTTISDTDTSGLSKGSYKHTLQITNALGKKSTVMSQFIPLV